MSDTIYMVLGIDVYHDTETRGHSWMALTASLNKNCTQYYSCTKKQSSWGQELIENLKVATTSKYLALKKYQNCTIEIFANKKIADLIT